MCERRALRVLDGLGDPTLGEWREWTGRAFHIRRRLTPAEESVVGPVVDVRGTEDARRRAAELGPILRHAPAHIVADEVGGE
jgi:hypothetical protein